MTIDELNVKLAERARRSRSPGTGSGAQAPPTSGSDPARPRTPDPPAPVAKNGSLPDNWRAGKTPKTPAADSSGRKPVFERHLRLGTIQDRIADGTLFAAPLRINKTNRQDGYVSPRGLDYEIFISGTKFMNRAFDGDIVAVELLDGEELAEAQHSQKQKKETKMLESRERQKKVEVFKTEDTALEHVETRVFGKVVGILDDKGSRNAFVGTLHMERPLSHKPPQNTDKAPRWIWFNPADKRPPFMVIPYELAPKEFLDDPKSFDGVLVTVRVRQWREFDNYPSAEYQGKLGQIGELPVETSALLAANGITWDDFDESVLACLPPTPWTIPDEEYAKRWDLRDLRIFSIDPETAKDLDDALSCRALPDGTFEVGVHIADVSYFVRPRTALDAEAYVRATTVYLVQRAIPMLPRLLCEQLCSLNPDVERFAFTVFWTFDADGNIVSEPRFGRSVIRSCAKLSYEQAQAVIDDTPFVKQPQLSDNVALDDVKQDILQLFEFSKVLRKSRYDGGALSIHSIKLWFNLDEFGNPINSGMYELKDSNRLIEEFMLLANMAVAEKIQAYFPEAALLRRHPRPAQSIGEFVSRATKMGFKIDASSSGSLQASFEAIQDPLQRMLVRMMAIKPMKRAEYFAAMEAEEPIHMRHYALSVPLYTHFTSPIRRYCDLVVHRLLDHAIRAPIDEAEPYDGKTVVDIAGQCNDRKNQAKEAQDASSNLYRIVYISRLLQPQVLLSQNGEALEGILAEGFVTDVNERSYDVLVPRYGIERRVWVEDAMEAGDVIGVTSDKDSLVLTVFWHRRADDPAATQAWAGEEPEEGVVALSEQMGGLSVADDAPAAPLDPRKTRVQRVCVFDKVVVRIQTFLDRSPPSFKLLPVYPMPGFEVPEARIPGVTAAPHLSIPAEMDD
ncbi:hypothetical protein HK105_201467 [Polyrhizophydium stewartii]|uniref:DIS3-like exonuclease 2 n=1 Tax=Polyrhizophydium stewartii TaxID=2732419 RepID=A0ABR4NI33_9FUNG